MSDTYEMEQVHGWRVRGRSWQTIAENLRRSTEDVRRRYDHSFIAHTPNPSTGRPRKKPVSGRAHGAPCGKLSP